MNNNNRRYKKNFVLMMCDNLSLGQGFLTRESLAKQRSCSIPGDSNPQLHHCENRKSRKWECTSP